MEPIMDLKALFLEHLDTRMRYASKALSATGFDALVISSGEPHTYFADDCDAPFRPVPHFRHHCPLPGPHHVLRIAPGQKPKLIRYAPEDFWYEQMPLGAPFWLDGFELVEAGTLDGVWEALGQPSRGAYIGNETARAEKAGLTVNPAALTAYLDWGRAYKSAYEIASLDEASALGAKGHQAGRRAFLEGASELQIHQAFVEAVGCLDHELAFPSIVALDPKGATLHYENKRTTGHGRVLLLDSGARVRDYPSDITRTTTAPGCDARFQALVAGVEKLQQELCAEIKPGVPFGDLHHLCHVKLAGLLAQSGLVRVQPEEALAMGLTRPFMPHGLGHHLGVQVHDVGGRLAGPDGALQPPPPQYPSLRTTRPLEVGHVVTIEPGLYFIPMLLRPFREGEHAAAFDWKLVDALAPFGGIRIEDNMLVTPDGGRNLTRPYLAD
jgi:Xaa-Pro dipeptidase